MAKKDEQRLVVWKELEESYLVEHGNFRVFVEVPEPEDSASRGAAKNCAAKIKRLLEKEREN